MADSTKRVRLAITSVMDAYGIEYQDVRRSNRPGIMFTVEGQTRTITYGGGDPRAHMNARTQTRRMLADLGLVPNGRRLADELETLPAAAEEEEGGSLLMETESNAQPIEEVSQSSSSVSIPMNEPEESTANQPDDSPTASDAPRYDPPRYTDAGYVVFTPTKYDSPQQVQLSRGRFFAVKLDRDLIATKGTMLVLPFDLPDVVLDMPEHEFKAYFQPVPLTSISPKTETPEPVITQAAVDEPVGEELQQSPSEQEFAAEDDDRPAQYPKAATSGESKRGVSPQMGRVLLAMLHLHMQGEVEITSQSIQALLSPVDAKQVAGMLSGAIKLRYVARGSALEGGRGTRFKLSVAGRNLAVSLQTWPYDHRGLAVPPWLFQTMRACAS